jgi:hypothetical protein
LASTFTAQEVVAFKVILFKKLNSPKVCLFVARTLTYFSQLESTEEDNLSQRPKVENEL